MPMADNNSSIIERPRFDQISDATKYVVNPKFGSNQGRQETSGAWPKTYNMDVIGSPVPTSLLKIPTDDQQLVLSPQSP